MGGDAETAATDGHAVGLPHPEQDAAVPAMQLRSHLASPLDKQGVRSELNFSNEGLDDVVSSGGAHQKRDEGG